MVTTTRVQWLNDRHFVGIDSTRHSVVLSAEENGIGAKPSDLLLIAVSACTAVDVVEILAKKRTPLTALEITATGEKDEAYPRPFRKIHLLYRVTGRGLTEKGVAQAIRLSQEKYCSVAATVRGVAEITTSFEIVETTDPETE